MRRQDIRNLAIVAHVDHGKTTLVDALLRQSGVFRSNEAVIDRVMDSFALERERGITIMAKQASIVWSKVHINIVDTPGHSDFGGEVERGLSMVDGILLLVDACEGPLPQTRFVLKKALEAGLPCVVCINKVDRSEARPLEVLDKVYDLFIDLEATDEQVDFPVVYTSAREGTAATRPDAPRTDMRPLFEAIISHLPGPVADPDGPLQFQANNLDYDDYVGRLAIGRVATGRISAGAGYALCRLSGRPVPCKVARLYGWHGLKRIELRSAAAGDIVMVAGIEDIEIGETISAAEAPRFLKPIAIDEPTVAMTFSVNNSPWAGREGRYVTSRKLGERIELETRRNVSVRAERAGTESWRVTGRGELQLAIIVETMRREGYEMQVSKPRALTRTRDGILLEPMEVLVVDIPAESMGAVGELLSRRCARLLSMDTLLSGRIRLEYRVPARGLIGLRGRFLEITHGGGVMHSLFDGFESWAGPIQSRVNGAMISDREGRATGYAIFHLQERGRFFISPGDRVYEGMIVGEHRRENNLTINVCRGKKLSNMRAVGHDEAVRIDPARRVTLDFALEWIDEEELVEVTPEAVRIRSRVLDTAARSRRRTGWAGALSSEQHMTGTSGRGEA